jgi:C4-dicarboxylate transporter DctQ subunit
VVRAATRLDAGLGRTDRVVMIVCCALLVVVSVDVLAAVFFRYVLNSSLLWAEELARYGSAWLVFLGLFCAHRRGEHVSLDSVVRRVPRIGVPAARVVAEVATTVICLTVAYLGWEMTVTNFDRGQTSPAMQIPIAWAYLSVPIGFLLMGLQSVVRAVLPSPEAQPSEVMG